MEALQESCMLPGSSPLRQPWKRSKGASYLYIMLEPSGNFKSSKSAFKSCGKKEGLLVKPRGITVRVNCCFFPNESKEILAGLIHRDAEECVM